MGAASGLEIDVELPRSEDVDSSVALRHATGTQHLMVEIAQSNRVYRDT